VLVSVRNMEGEVVHLAARHIVQVSSSVKEWDDPDTTLMEILMVNRHKVTAVVNDASTLLRQIGQQSQRG